MKSFSVDVSLIRKPEFVVSVPDEKTFDEMCQDMINSANLKKYHVVTVNDGKGFVAVDNIAVLDAAIKANLSKIHVLNLGKADPLLTHIETSSQKEMVNPARICLAMHSIRQKNEKQKVSLNSYLQKILAVDFDVAILSLLADMMDYIFATGIKESPPVSYFSALSRLDIEKQKIAIEKTQVLCQELRQRYFTWPNTHIFNLLLDGEKKPDTQPMGSASKSIPNFNCTCGNHYGLINNKICKLEEKDGCLLVNDRFDDVLHMIPEKGVKFLGLEKDDSPKFSMHKSIDDLKKMKFDGPFLLVRMYKKE